ncbi:glycine-rich cell wall structural protein 1-like [Olea europaea var. sylvestris]|uniref:glycine-rich cell wall structural protein 1-like n=1 Tax=Olea europaea var. sylvestris TaxID=158386 RepID=UPI000C1D2C30|nr:glycine-rich cell wall structural protein 1-like [Olea europaea var. sylvestris]
MIFVGVDGGGFVVENLGLLVVENGGDCGCFVNGVGGADGSSGACVGSGDLDGGVEVGRKLSGACVGSGDLDGGVEVGRKLYCWVCSVVVSGCDCVLVVVMVSGRGHVGDGDGGYVVVFGGGSHVWLSSAFVGDCGCVVVDDVGGGGGGGGGGGWVSVTNYIWCL